MSDEFEETQAYAFTYAAKIPSEAIFIFDCVNLRGI